MTDPSSLRRHDLDWVRIAAFGLRRALQPALEGPLLIVATLAACFASFEVVRRVGWLRPLFGLSGSRTTRPVARVQPGVQV